MNQQGFIDAVVPAAQEGQRKFGVPASLTIAQAILESGWGRYAEGNNLFGIKWRDGDEYNFVQIATTEYYPSLPKDFISYELQPNGKYKVRVYAKFRKYDSWSDSIRDHTQFLCKDRYIPVRKAKNYVEACVAVHECGYATDPQYAGRLIALIEQYDLDDYDDERRCTMDANKLVNYVNNAYLDKWGYVLTGQGEYYTAELAEQWIKSKYHYPHAGWNGSQREYFTVACAKWYGHYVADCSGLIVAAFRTENPKYQDQVADTFKARFKESGPISTLPEIPGLALWRPGHIGIYIGDGWAIEARGYKYGVVRTRVADRTWTHWGRLADIDYEGDNDMITKNMKGDLVKRWQEALLVFDNNLLPVYGADGWYGNESIAGTKVFQKKMGVNQSGNVDLDTFGVMVEFLMSNTCSSEVKNLRKKNEQLKSLLATIHRTAQEGLV